MQPLVNLSIVFCLYSVVKIKEVIKVFVFHISESISLRPAFFRLLIFVSTTLSYSSLNCSSLMSGWLLVIFMRALSVTLRMFPSRFLQCSFLICIRSSWLAALSFALDVFFLSAHFIYCLPCYS